MHVYANSFYQEWIEQDNFYPIKGNFTSSNSQWIDYKVILNQTQVHWCKLSQRMIYNGPFVHIKPVTTEQILDKNIF